MDQQNKTSVMVLKFLLIDDDADDRDLFCEALYSIDQQIICYTAAGCRKALAKLDAQEIELPDIIFLDINMPGMDGWHCLSLLKNHEIYRQIPVIIYSTTSHMEDIERTQASGALCFFTKPSSFTNLKQVLELIIKPLKTGSLAAVAEILSFTPESYRP
jgi:CheY-like chemotaxis protein